MRINENKIKEEKQQCTLSIAEQSRSSGEWNRVFKHTLNVWLRYIKMYKVYNLDHQKSAQFWKVCGEMENINEDRFHQETSEVTLRLTSKVGQYDSRSVWNKSTNIFKLNRKCSCVCLPTFTTTVRTNLEYLKVFTLSSLSDASPQLEFSVSVQSLFSFLIADSDRSNVVV